MTLTVTLNAAVRLDLTEARAGSREAIRVDVPPRALNPGEARALIADIEAACKVVDQLAPPLALAKETA